MEELISVLQKCFGQEVFGETLSLGINGFLIETKKTIFIISFYNIVSSVQKPSIIQQKLSLVVPPLRFEGIAVIGSHALPTSGSLAGLHSQKTPCHPVPHLDCLQMSLGNVTSRGGFSLASKNLLRPSLLSVTDMTGDPVPSSGGSQVPSFHAGCRCSVPYPPGPVRPQKFSLAEP